MRGGLRQLYIAAVRIEVLGGNDLLLTSPVRISNHFVTEWRVSGTADSPIAPSICLSASWRPAMSLHSLNRHVDRYRRTAHVARRPPNAARLTPDA